MKAFYVYGTVAVLLMLTGLFASLFNDKAHFLIWLFGWRNPVADYYFYYITVLGEWYGFVFFGIMLWLQSWRKMLPIPILGVTVTIVSYLLKQFFQHERPSVYLEKTDWEGTISVLGYHVLSGHHSFPSGHSMAAWALFTLMAAIIRKPWFSILSLFLATSVSLSRIYLMAHFLQDVVAGAMIGFALGYGAYYFYDRWKRSNDNRTALIQTPDSNLIKTE
jgi:membrane-associated phospholipid phosphatase